MNRTANVCLFALLSCAGCSGGQVDLGASAGSGNLPASAGASGAVDMSSASMPSKDSRSMTLQFGATRYEFYCPDTSARSSSEKWAGALIDAYHSDFVDPNPCQWPVENHSLYVMVSFTNLDRHEGFAPGTYDLAQPIVQNVVVTVVAQSQKELPVGQIAPIASYASSLTGLPAVDASPTTPAAGASGTVTVVKFNPYTPSHPNFDVTLTNVVLPIVESVEGYPDSITIETARILNSP